MLLQVHIQMEIKILGNFLVCLMGLFRDLVGPIVIGFVVVLVMMKLGLFFLVVGFGVLVVLMEVDVEEVFVVMMIWVLLVWLMFRRLVGHPCLRVGVLLSLSFSVCLFFLNMI